MNDDYIEDDETCHTSVSVRVVFNYKPETFWTLFWNYAVLSANLTLQHMIF